MKNYTLVNTVYFSLEVGSSDQEFKSESSFQYMQMKKIACNALSGYKPNKVDTPMQQTMLLLFQDCKKQVHFSFLFDLTTRHPYTAFDVRLFFITVK